MWWPSVSETLSHHTELLSSERFSSFWCDLVYYLQANRFIFNLLPWPAAMEPRHSRIFQRSLSHLAMNNLELFLGAAAIALGPDTAECESCREASKTIISAFIAAVWLEVQQKQQSFRFCLDSLRTVIQHKWDPDQSLTFIMEKEGACWQQITIWNTTENTLQSWGVFVIDTADLIYNHVRFFYLKNRGHFNVLKPSVVWKKHKINQFLFTSVLRNEITDENTYQVIILVQLIIAIFF